MNLLFLKKKQQKDFIVITHLPLQLCFPAKSRIYEPAPRSKSLLVLFFRKEQEILLFLKKKKQKDFYFWAPVRKSGTWPDSEVKSNSFQSWAGVGNYLLFPDVA